MKKSRVTVEHLETRYAPATLVNPFTVTYTNGDNTVFVKITKPVFEQATIDSVLIFFQGSVDGDNSSSQELKLIDLTGLAAAGAKLTIINPSPGKGVDTLSINAAGIDLAGIVQDGQIKDVTVGDADLSTPGLGFVKARELQQGGTLTIMGDVKLLSFEEEVKGFVDVTGSIGSVTCFGVAGTAVDDGGHIRATGDIQSILVRDSIIGDGGGARTGFIEAGGSIGKIRIGSDILGGSAAQSGRIQASGDIGFVKIGGDLVGENGVDGGTIVTFSGRIAKVTIGGSIISGSGLRSGSIRAGFDLGSLKVGGDLDGANGVPVVVSGFGQIPSDPVTDLAIGKIKIGGSVTNAQILAGYDFQGNPLNNDAQIGSVKVGGDWIGGSILAGMDDGADNLFGTNDDPIDEAGSGDPNIRSRIDKIIIAGTADGTAAAGDHFGFVAQDIGFCSIAGTTLPTLSIPGSSGAVLGTQGDFVLQEIG